MAIPPSASTPQALENAANDTLIQQLTNNQFRPNIIFLGDGMDKFFAAAQNRGLNVTTTNVNNGVDLLTTSSNARISAQRRNTSNDVFTLERNFYPDPNAPGKMGSVDPHANIFFDEQNTGRYYVQMGWGSILALKRVQNGTDYYPSHLFVAGTSMMSLLNSKVNAIQATQAGQVALADWSLQQGFVKPRNYSVYTFAQHYTVERVITRSVQSCSAAILIPDVATTPRPDLIVFAHTNNNLPNPLPSVLRWLQLNDTDYQGGMTHGLRGVATIYPSLIEAKKYSADNIVSQLNGGVQADIVLLARESNLWTFDPVTPATVFQPHEAFGLDLSSSTQIKLVSNYGHYRPEIGSSSTPVWQSLYSSMGGLRSACTDSLVLRPEASLRQQMSNATSGSDRQTLRRALVSQMLTRALAGDFSAAGIVQVALAKLARSLNQKEFTAMNGEEQRRLFAEFIWAMIDYTHPTKIKDHPQAYTAMEEACIENHAVCTMEDPSLYHLFTALQTVAQPLANYVELRPDTGSVQQRFDVDFKKMARQGKAWTRQALELLWEL